jgi:hypothetical protein
VAISRIKARLRVGVCMQFSWGQWCVVMIISKCQA